MKKVLALSLGLSLGLNAQASDQQVPYDWTPISIPESLTASETENFKLGLLSSSALLCGYFTLYSELEALPTNPVPFERAKSAVVRQTRTLTPEQCRTVLTEVTKVLTQ